jgi:hypothetical protein
MAFKLFAGAAVACFGGLAVTYVNQSSPDLDRYVAEARRRADAAGSSLDVNKFPTAEELKKGFGNYAAAVGDQLRQSLRPAQGRKLRLEALHEPTHGTYDFVVVGGGIIGTAIARQLLLEYPTKTVCLLEKEAALAQHQSSHNSGVIHAGIYSDPQLLITGLCVRGGRMMYEFCEKAGVPCKRVGKLVVAFREDQVPALDVFKRNAETAGQTGLQIIHGREAIKALEPAVEGLAALVSNETGIADFAALTRRMGREILGEAPFTKLSSATRKIQWSAVEAAASQQGAPRLDPVSQGGRRSRRPGSSREAELQGAWSGRAGDERQRTGRRHCRRGAHGYRLALGGWPSRSIAYRLPRPLLAVGTEQSNARHTQHLSSAAF